MASKGPVHKRSLLDQMGGVAALALVLGIAYTGYQAFSDYRIHKVAQESLVAIVGRLKEIREADSPPTQVIILNAPGGVSLPAPFDGIAVAPGDVASIFHHRRESSIGKPIEVSRVEVLSSSNGRLYRHIELQGVTLRQVITGESTI